jgi:hypothetical protein
MDNIEIEEIFKRNYLICGNSYDNFIFHGCPKAFLDVAYKSLSENKFGIVPVLVKITRKDEEIIEDMLKDYQDKEFYKTIICRDYVNARVLNEVYKGTREKSARKSVLSEHVKAFENGEFYKVKQYHATAPFMHDILDAYRSCGKFEVNFFLEDTENVYIEKAINNFMSSRTPFTVKIFATKDKLPTYYDEGGNVIQSPHDYMTRDVKKFIRIKEDNVPEF